MRHYGALDLSSPSVRPPLLLSFPIFAYNVAATLSAESGKEGVHPPSGLSKGASRKHMGETELS